MVHVLHKMPRIGAGSRLAAKSLAETMPLPILSNLPAGFEVDSTNPNRHLHMDGGLQYNWRDCWPRRTAIPAHNADSTSTHRWMVDEPHNASSACRNAVYRSDLAKRGYDQLRSLFPRGHQDFTVR